MVRKIFFEIKDRICEYIFEIRCRKLLKKHYKKCKDNNIPISKYDIKSKKAYLEYSDGSKIYME